MKGSTLGYCIFNNPFSQKGDVMIFVTKKDSPTLNFEIFDRPVYKKTCKLLQKMGFIQSELLTFESVKNNEFSIEKIQETLEENGLTYNKNLEASILKEISYSGEERELPKDSVVEIVDFLKTKEMQEGKRIPEVGDMIELYFYLFLDCEPTKTQEISFSLNGDFHSKKGSGSKKFIQAVGAKFKRVERRDSTDLFFESIPTYQDFFHRIDCLYTARLSFEQEFINEEKDYFEKNVSIIEAKKDLCIEKKIIVQVDAVSNFKYLMEWSADIKNEILSEKHRSISTDFLKKRTENTIARTKKLLVQSIQEEKYEVSDDYKNFIVSLQEHHRWLDSLTEPTISLTKCEEEFSIGKTIQKKIT